MRLLATLFICFCLSGCYDIDFFEPYNCPECKEPVVDMHFVYHTGPFEDQSLTPMCRKCYQEMPLEELAICVKRNVLLAQKTFELSNLDIVEITRETMEEIRNDTVRKYRERD